MKAKLEFNLPEDTRAHRLASQAPDMESVLIMINEMFRNRIKFNSDQHSEEAIGLIEKLRSEFIEELEDRNLLWVLD